MERLRSETLDRLPSGIVTPAFDPADVTCGILHLGIGAFHRAHQAIYTDDILHRDSSWGISGASLRSATTRDALEPQDGLYTVVTRSGEGDAARVIASVREVLVAREDPAALLSRMADPAIRIVSLTVTEKGYCHDPVTGELDEDHEDIRHDLATPELPRSAPGFVVEALNMRRRRGVPPFTVLSCDNLPANGSTTARIVSRMAALRDPDLGAFVGGEVAFPSSMVDRIVPATTEQDRALVGQLTGLQDAWPVITEPFTQWVIEDRFSQGRPVWEAAGAELVSDVEPYEQMKLRLLNGSHSTLAYLGSLSGFETVSDAMTDSDMAGLIRALMDKEMTPVLNVPPNADVDGYKASLIERFRNPALRHRLAQIAMDGSQKIPQRLLSAARQRIAAGAPTDRITLAVAAWMQYVTGTDQRGKPYPVSDPLAPQIAVCANAAGRDAGALTNALLGLTGVFGDDLPANPAFKEAVSTWLDRLIRLGARRVIDDWRHQLL